ncbi:hypothetical protein CDD81_4545 [Ophiocordyceps australis]|uniref:Stress-response A/B barrel domain-containing protein n=1 Tax=Ophiocordyceps australis TaxID=1399860 RepID=A0A2C5YAH4_9HYPO|nr:hypothetical protein CDD81_4545 [Ophiocordyceps australis]
MARIVHVVLFQFKSETPESERKELSQKMLRLKTSCIHPTLHRPYITSSVGGLDNSIEGSQDGFTHAFVVEFESQQDRDYYVRHDPAHKAFVSEAMPRLARAHIVDFVPGEL